MESTSRSRNQTAHPSTSKKTSALSSVTIRQRIIMLIIAFKSNIYPKTSKSKSSLKVFSLLLRYSLLKMLLVILVNMFITC